MLRRRTWWWIQLSYLGLLLAGWLVYSRRMPEVTDATLAIRAAREFLRCEETRNFGRQWELMSEAYREWIVGYYMDGDDEITHLMWSALYRAGVTKESLEGAESREKYTTTRGALDRGHVSPHEPRGPIEWFLSLFRKRRAPADGPWVIGPGKIWFEGMLIARESGRWKVDPAGTPRGRELALFISCLPQWQRKTDFVVELGPLVPAESELELLTAALRSRLGHGPFGRFVLIDADPDHRLEEIIHVIDAVMAAGTYEVNLARSGRLRLDPGIRVNGVPLLEIPLVHILPPATDHPALERAFSVDPR